MRNGGCYAENVYLCTPKLNIYLSQPSMKRKDYEKPTTQVVELQQRTMLLAGSGVDATRDDYGDANPDVDLSELDNITGVWLWN